MADLIMVYDTETTGVKDFKAAWNAEHQPNLLQLGYKVYDRKREVIFEIGHLVDTTGFKEWRGIEPGAQAVHGISEDSVKMYGSDPDKSMKAFNYWAEKSFLFVAHNEQFDNGIMQCFAYRAGWNPDVFQGKPKYCTMMTSTNICKIPSPNGRGGYKWPKLNEAYPFFFDGAQFKGAHNALADVNPTGEIFWEHIDRGLYALSHS